MKRQRKYYTCHAVEQVMERYSELGGESVELEEGVLGYGLTVCFGDKLKTTVIREVYWNPWESVHTIRHYNKMPKKYEKMIEDYYDRED